MRTFVSVIVLNIRILSYPSLETISLLRNSSQEMFVTSPINNVTYSVHAKYSTRFPGSIPFMCYYALDEIFTDDLPMDDNVENFGNLKNRVFCGLYSASGTGVTNVMFGIPILNVVGGLIYPGAPYCDW